MPFAASHISPDTAASESAERIATRSGTSFFWAMRLLSKSRREGMFAIYAFCREVDDLADDSLPQAEKIEALSKWRAQIERLYADGKSAGLSLTARALAEPIRSFGLRKEDFLAVIDGMEMDANGPVRRPSMKELELYCARVAGAVGRLSVHAFGAPGAKGYAVADKLGQALQLTNILRDLREDAGEGRLYLPAELLEKHGITGCEPGKVLAHPALPAVCEDLARLAERRFREAEAALAECSRRQMRPAVVMMRVYRKLLEGLRARGWKDLDRSVGLSKVEKIWIALRHGIF